MNTIGLRIDTMIIETEGERQDAEQFRGTLQEAFVLLAQRLERSPFGRWHPLRPLVIDRLELDDLAVDAALGARGAERLAEALYQALLRRLA